MPSPAFTTGRRVDSSSSQAAPEELWRRIMASAPSARRVRPVSFSDSPFSMLELRLETSVVSAPSAFGGQLKAGSGARGRLVEEQCDAALGQDAVAHQRVFVFEGRGAGKNAADAFHAQVHYREQRAGMVRKRRSGRWRRVKLAANGGCGWDSYFSASSLLASSPSELKLEARELAFLSRHARPAAPARCRRPRGT